MKKVTYLIFAFGLLQMAQSALVASPPVGTPIAYEVTVGIGSGTAKINGAHYQITSGEYIGKYAYTYQITNIDSGVGLSFFSVGIANGVNVAHCDTEGAVNPYWGAIGDNPPALVQSVDALFYSPIKNNNSSAMLWFVSDFAPGLEQGALFGTSAGAPQYATAELFAPVPEPATLSLFAIGGTLAAVARKQKTM